MAQNDYTIVVDPSGQLLQNLDEVVYQNYDVSYIPIYGKTYKLTNYNQTTIANKFVPYTSSPSLNDYQDYMTFDLSDNLYITDRNGNNPTIQTFITNDIVLQPGRFADIGYDFSMNFPYGLAFDASNILYVTMNNSRTWSSVTRSWILKINLTTLVGIEISVPGITFGHLYGCAFDSSDNFYVADNTNNRIIKITMVDYSTGTASIYANLYNGLNQPTDISFDSYDNAYISNVGGFLNSKNIIKCSTNGTSSIFATGFKYPYTLAYNVLENILYVADFVPDVDNGVLFKVINGIATNNSNDLGLPVNPYSLAINSKGQLCVTSIPSSYSSSQTGLITIYVMVPNNVVSNYSTDVSGNLSFSSVRFDSSYTYLYACAFNTNQIWRFANTGLNVGIVIYSDASSGPSLNGPTDIAFEPTGGVFTGSGIYVSNITTNEIIYINLSTNVGQLVQLVFISGGFVFTPSSMQFNGAGLMYVANYSSNTISILTFSNPTTATSIWMGPIIGQQIFTPNSLSFNQPLYTKLYVSCQNNNTILEINTTTLVSTKYNLTGQAISSPTGIFYDSTSGILYISNQTTNEIYYITNYNYVVNLELIETTSNALHGPLKIVLDNSNNLYVANSSNIQSPIVSINQDNTALVIYDATTSDFQTPSNFVPDRTTKSTYVYEGSKMYILDKNNNISVINGLTVNSTSAPPMILGTDISGNKFLALVASNTAPARITFVPYTTIPSGGPFITQNTGISVNTSPYRSAFANISATKKMIFISTQGANSPVFPFSITTSSIFRRVDVINASVPNATTFSSTAITINGLPALFQVSQLAVYPKYQSGTNTQYLYIGMNNTRIIYRVNINVASTTYTATEYFKLNNSSSFNTGCRGLDLDDNGYLYCMLESGQNLYRVIPNPPSPGSGVSPPSSYTLLYTNITNIIPNPNYNTYSIWDQSLIIISSNARNISKYYIGFPFTGMNSVNTIGPYDDTGYIFDVTAGANIFDLSFNIYTPYVVIDPSNIPLNTRTEVSIHFVIPFVQPGPSDSYKLLCDGEYISDVFCNNCTYNKSTFLAGTFPTGLVYSTDSQFLYVALDNDTISRISPLGIVENDFIPSTAGLKGPTSLVLDSNFNMFILNAGSDFISFLTLENNIISVDNSFFTGINTPICLTYDNYSNDYLYLLSGIVPNMRLTKILASDSSDNQIIGLPFGTLYNSNGLTICEFNPGSKFLYISDTDQNGINRIIQVNLSNGLYTPTTLITNLTYKPYTMANNNDGYLYIANKTSNNISKVSVQSDLIQPSQNIQPWVSNSISVPAGLCFDGSGNLYVANSGTNPRNSRISKIYIDYFFFTDVVISSTPCIAQIYDTTTNSYVDVNYYEPPGDPTTFPIPIPYPINS